MRRPSAYRVFLTRKSEYHVRGNVCFGVRDRRTGSWRSDHWALGCQLTSLGVPAVSEPLCFLVGEAPHYTSVVISIEEREQLELPRRMRINPRLYDELVQRAPGSIRETY
jgi:hypothetical protein